MFTAEQETRLMEALKAPKARYDKIARMFGTTEMAVRNFDIEVLGRWKRSQDGWGDPAIRKFAVARRHIDGMWDDRSERIREARNTYDNGTHEMCSGRDGLYIILYSIPRKEPVLDRRPYFRRDFGRG
jgi:hypothetical protein